MLLGKQAPSYLKKYGFTYQTNDVGKNMCAVEGYTTKTNQQNELFDTIQITDTAATYRLEYFIDTTAAEPAQSDRIFKLQWAFYKSDDTRIKYQGAINITKGKKEYITFDFVCPEDTAYIKLTTNRYPSTVADYNKVIYSGIQLYKVESPLPDSPVDMKPNVEAGRYYIEHDGSKYEFTLPALDGMKDTRDIFYFDKKKKSAFVIRKTVHESIDVQGKSIYLTASDWQRDGYTSFFISPCCKNASQKHYRPCLINRLKPGHWAWQNLADGNYGFAYAPNGGNSFYAIIQSSYLQITDSDTDEQKKAKIRAFLTQNPTEIIYETVSEKKIPITLTKVQTSTAEKLDLWEE